MTNQDRKWANKISKYDRESEINQAREDFNNCCDSEMRENIKKWQIELCIFWGFPQMIIGYQDK